MSMEDDKKVCDVCDLHSLKLYVVDKRIVCSLCKKDYEVNGAFTRPKVKHDYKGAEVFSTNLKKRGH